MIRSGSFMYYQILWKSAFFPGCFSRMKCESFHKACFYRENVAAGSRCIVHFLPARKSITEFTSIVLAFSCCLYDTDLGKSVLWAL